MTEEDRAKLYWGLLSGLAETAQAELCARGHHSWGRAVQTALRTEMPSDPMRLTMDATVTIRHDQMCTGCGKLRVF